MKKVIFLILLNGLVNADHEVLLTTQDFKKDYRVLQVVYVFQNNCNEYSMEEGLYYLVRKVKDLKADGIVGLKIIPFMKDEDRTGLLFYGTAIKFYPTIPSN